MKLLKKFPFILQFVCFALFSTASIFAAAGDVDQTFITSVGINQIDSPTALASTVLQPDGKIIILGNFKNIDGVPKNKIGRLNTDGTLDNSFNCACENFTSVSSAVVQTDGKLIIAGHFGDYLYRRFARLNADGSLDGSFVFAGGLQDPGNATVLAVQPDGKILIATHYSAAFVSVTYLSRLNSNGSYDSSFSTLTFNTRPLVQDALNQLQILPDGKIMIGGKHQFGYIFRINADGTRDSSFESPALTVSTQFPQNVPSIYSFGIQSSGKIVIAGNFLTVNGIGKNGFARLNQEGSLDLAFTATPSINFFKMAMVSNDKIHLGSSRLNADGTPDNTYNPAFTISVYNWRLDTAERVLFTQSFTENGVANIRIGRMNADGSADNTFHFPLIALNGEVLELAVQTDGKMLVSGYFSTVNGIPRRDLVRVNSDGSLDNSFSSGIGIVGTIRVIVLQTDGKILIGGDIQNYNSTQRFGLVRLNSDGSADSSFNPVIGSTSFYPTIAAIAIQPDGKIIVGGGFSSVNGITRTSLARLNSDGSLDASFNPVLGSAAIYSIISQANGKIMVGGSFVGVNGFNRANIVRVNNDSSIDTTFNAGSIQSVSQIIQNPNGKYTLIAGSIVRRNADGTVDSSFQIPVFETGGANSTFPKRILLQTDGSLIVVGQFFSINSTPRNNIARIKPNGFVDTLFLPTGTDRIINTITAQSDGKLILGGSFSTIEGVARSGIARITPPVFRNQTMFDYDGDGRADVSVFRPSENKWYIYRSSDNQITQQIFAIGGDTPVPADFDGDGKTDFSIFRNSLGDWWSLSSLSGNQVFNHWGANGDIPRPSDFDGDGRSDYVIFRAAENNWYRISSATGISSTKLFGAAGDKPVIGDFDGDGKSDVAIYRPSTGDWWWQSSVDNVQRATRWGISTDIPAPADYDGDGKTDFAVYRPSTGVWYIYNSSNGTSLIAPFGLAEDKPVAADYDGDGKADIAVFRPSTGIWYLMRSTAGFTALQFGISTDIPTQNAFVP